MNKIWQFNRCLLLLLVLYFFQNASCTTSTTNPFPEESQSGKNVIACRIDGIIWLPYFNYLKDPLRQGGEKIARYSKKNKTLYVGGTNEKDSKEINFSLINCTSEGRYILESQNDDVLRPIVNSGAFSPQVYINDYTFWTTSDFKGEVVITKLTDSIVSGRFSFKAFNQKTIKSVNISEGHFDFYYLPGVDD